MVQVGTGAASVPVAGIMVGTGAAAVEAQKIMVGTGVAAVEAWSLTDPIVALGPRHYYRLNGTTVDEMGMTDLYVSSFRAGLGPEYLTFNDYSAGGYVQIADLPAGTTGAAYTVCMWIRPTSLGEYPGLFARGSGTSNSVDVYRGTGSYNIDTYNNTGTERTAPFVLNEWQHVAFRITHTGTGTTSTQMWYNGSSLGTGSFSRGTRHSASDPLRIGSAWTGSYPFIGDMDTLVYFTRALSNAEVLQVYEVGRR